MTPHSINTAGLAACAALSCAAAAQQPIDKSRFHLFNPTPRELMRDLAPDRPDVTESPHTVDAGHVQIELSFVDYVRDGETRTFTVLPVNFKVGLLNDLDVQLVLDPYVHVREASADSASGFGDTQLRFKLNLWGNDDGDSALAIMPFIKFPTASDDLGNDHVEGGLIIPFATSVDDWGVGLMAELDGVFDEQRDTYGLEFVHTAALGRELMPAIGGYIEYIGVASTAADSEYQVSLGTGLTFELNADWMLDAGVIIGLAGGAPDFNPFAGMTIRF